MQYNVAIDPLESISQAACFGNFPTHQYSPGLTLKGSGNLQKFSEAVQAYLLPLSGTTRLILRRKAELFLYRQNADAIFYIERGLVKIDRPGEGDQCVTLNLCSAGELIGEEALMAHQTYQTQAEALTPLTVLRIPSNQVLEATASNPQLALFLLSASLRRKATLERRLELVAAHDVERRILLCLADFAELGEHEEDGSYSLPLTQRDVANLIGATRETTSLMLNQMERIGLLSLARGKVTIPNPNRLRTAAYPIAEPIAS
jgi:CRP/FNR family cyclic AMP-dependent transcriptional regulator